ncbi:MAG: RHS repeat protein [Oscillospiraceae bacterium]|nr:RHS repeat protein [Oscillospiraceae bacterium]
MKRWSVCLLLPALILVLLAGCAGDAAPETARVLEQETPAPSSDAGGETPSPETGTEPAGAHDWAEPDAVDDGFSFRYAWRASCSCDGASDHFRREELPAYVERWVDGGEILDSSFLSIDDSFFGWVCFSGAPKTELGWKTARYEGRDCYCRGFIVHGEKDESGMGVYTVSRSIAMEPLKMLQDFRWDEEHQELLQLRRELPELQSAELYVPALGQSFLMTDPDALESLRRAFSEPENEVERIRELQAEISDRTGVAPLYLRYADGSSSLAIAAGDGSDVCAVWGLPDSVFGPQSLFERFGVPLPSPGYSHEADGSTVIQRTVEGLDRSLQLAIRHDYRYTFDPEGRLVRFEHRFHREDGAFDSSELRIYHYSADGKPETVEQHSESADSGSSDFLATYTYDEAGRLTRYAYDDRNDGTRGMYYEYRYDEEGRIAAVIYHYRDGREGLPSGNSYYWYDEDGQRHAYGMDENGNLVGGPGGDAGDAPIRR